MSKKPELHTVEEDRVTAQYEPQNELVQYDDNLPTEQHEEEVDLEQYGSMGYEDVSARDTKLPYFRLIQKTSDEVEEAKANYIPEAKAGMWIDGVTRDLYLSLVVTPCKFITQWLERTTGNPGDFVANHGIGGITLVDTCQRDDKKHLILPSGNKLVEQALWWVNVLGGFSVVEQQFVSINRMGVIIMQSTNLGPSRKWMQRTQALRYERKDGSKYQPPLFGGYYKLGSMPQTNAEGKVSSLMTWAYMGKTSELKNARKIVEDCQEIHRIAEELYKKNSSTIGSSERTLDDDVPF